MPCGSYLIQSRYYKYKIQFYVRSEKVHKNMKICRKIENIIFMSYEYDSWCLIKIHTIYQRVQPTGLPQILIRRASEKIDCCITRKSNYEKEYTLVGKITNVRCSFFEYRADFRKSCLFLHHTVNEETMHIYAIV